MELEQTAYQFILHPDGQRLVFLHSVPTRTPGRSDGGVGRGKPPAQGSAREEVRLFAFVAAITIPLGLDLHLPVPEDNPLNARTH